MPPKPQKATGLSLVDRLEALDPPELADYVQGVSEYVRERQTLTDGQAKAAQIRLSNALGKALLAELRSLLPGLKGVAGEHTVSGALRTVQADVSAWIHRVEFWFRPVVDVK